MKRLLILLILFPFLLNGQTSNGFLIKTLVLQDAFHQNPNVIFEKLMNNNLSVELLLALRNGDWYIQGGEGPSFAKFSTSKGFTVGASTRYYLMKQTHNPHSWFVSGTLRYNNTKIKNAKIQTGIHSEPRTVNLNRKGPEIGITVGRQMIFLEHFTIEVYIGGGTYLRSYQEEYVAGPENEVKADKTAFIFRPYLGMTFGYLFRNSAE
ncbi:MAG TPA: DUF3575 domain-containing protein [Lentimicrobium sp.]|nr:DUF3575 domain-containing protein [Lentimicrobium sp.]